jgi:hypothetical protein
MTIDWTVWFPVLYVGLMAGACVFAVAWMIATAMQRQAQGKPLVTPALPYTLFRETRASAYVGQPRFRWSHSGVRRGMLVAVTPQHLILAPQFPNSLMFLSGGEAFEQTVPLGEILCVERTRAAWTYNVSVDFRDATSQVRHLRLCLQDPDAFVSAVREPPQWPRPAFPASTGH